ncbi:PDC sensor domain-containing protein [Bradyrhizobium sp. C-145]|uniref:PDC sensor domain-containing protein n=1 Tax=Bradyrhizobium sp. C-145 TaxID=574727 RepID=UPI00201B59F1|nr:PDC sensor domain-containing protein [Bradyrhizobium sp. C-145]UQR65436.1 PDC sensor domain-containing protein [Bradyrhizobium sp. C-145]
MNGPFQTARELTATALPVEFEALAPPPLLLPGEHLEHYQALRQVIFADLAPRSAIEWLLAIDVAELSWEIQRYLLNGERWVPANQSTSPARTDVAVPRGVPAAGANRTTRFLRLGVNRIMPNRGLPSRRPCIGAAFVAIDLLATVRSALFRPGLCLHLCGRLCRVVASIAGWLVLRSVTFVEAEFQKRAAQEILASIEREIAGIQNVLLALAASPATHDGELAQFQRRAAKVARQLDLPIVLREVGTGQPVIGPSLEPDRLVLQNVSVPTREAIRRTGESGRPAVSGAFFDPSAGRYVVTVAVPFGEGL